jgi:hypothetical protein
MFPTGMFPGLRNLPDRLVQEDLPAKAKPNRR